MHEKTGGPLKIIEVGAGIFQILGACSAADSILLFFKNYDKKLYNSMTYEIVELSSVMQQRATNKLSINHEALIKNN